MPKAILLYVRYVEIVNRRVGRVMMYGFFVLVGLLTYISSEVIEFSRAALVDGERVAGDLDAARELGVVELVLAARQPAQAPQRDAERAHRVPDADHADRSRLLKAVILSEGHAGRVIGMLLVAVECDGVAVVAHRAPLEDAALADHAADAAHRERAAAEAEEVQLVPRLVVRHEEPVGVVDVLLQPLAEGAAGHPVERVAGELEPGQPQESLERREVRRVPIIGRVSKAGTMPTSEM